MPHSLRRSGKLKALGTGGQRRAIALPDMPTLSESGLRGYNADNWYALLAPHGTAACRHHSNLTSTLAAVTG